MDELNCCATVGAADAIGAWRAIKCGERDHLNQLAYHAALLQCDALDGMVKKVVAHRVRSSGRHFELSTGGGTRGVLEVFHISGRSTAVAVVELILGGNAGLIQIKGRSSAVDCAAAGRSIGNCSASDLIIKPSSRHGSIGG